MEQFMTIFQLTTVVGKAANPGMWGTFVNFLGSILQWINSITNNYGLSVVLFTILMRFALLPLDLKAKASTKKVNEIQPKINEINEKYKNDSDKRSKKTMELYQAHGVNPLGGCLPMLIQLPVFFALFAALRQIANNTFGEFLINLINNHNPSISAVIEQIAGALENSAIKQSMVEILPQIFARPDASIVKKMSEIAGSENVSLLVDTIKNISNEEVYQFLQNAQFSSYRFLWIKNIWIADSPFMSVSGRGIDFLTNGYNGLFILPILAGLTSYYQTKLTNPSSGSEQTKGFTAIFPIMSVWFTSMYTAAFAVYWVTSNIFQIVQQTLYNRINSPRKEGAKK